MDSDSGSLSSPNPPTKRNASLSSSYTVSGISSTLESTSDSSRSHFESGSLTETSLTDITSTLGSSAFTDADTDKRRHITKEMLQTKQLLHDIQVLKIELSQKNLMLDTMKAEFMNRIDELEDKLSDATHERQLMQAKYDSQIRVEREESGKHIKRLKLELQKCLENNIHLKSVKEKLEKLSTVEKDIALVEIEEREYAELKTKSDNEISLQERVNVMFYEQLRPLRMQIDSLEQRLKLTSDDVREKEDELAQLRLENEEVRQARAELDVRCQRFHVQIEDLQRQLHHRNYKDENFNLVQSERDTLERHVKELEKSSMAYKNELHLKAEELDHARKQFMEQTQTLALLKQDKDYLTKQLNELQPRYQVLDERLDATLKQLDEAKQAREDLYEKYVSARDQYRKEYEERIKREISEISSRTNYELERVKESTKELYDRENRNLRETRDNALVQLERITSKESESQKKYNDLLGEFRQLQLSSEGKISECQNELKLKGFELDRTQLLHEEVLKNVKQLGIANEALQKKIEALNKEYYSMQSQLERKIGELENRHADMQSKLTIYEKLEQELDDVVMQAAELADEADSERVLFAYGYGANLPSTAKRRMQQSVHLARRVLQLERANTSLRHELERETKKLSDLSSELKGTTQLLNEAQQPYTYLIDSIRTRDEQNKNLKSTINTLEEDNRRLKEENSSIKKSNNQMAADLERLLNQREELSVLRHVVSQLQSTNTDKADSLLARKTLRTSSAVSAPETFKRSSEKRDFPEGLRPQPVVFTKAEPPGWYLKLKQKNELQSKGAR